MRAIICRGYGPPDDVLQLADIDEPDLADDAVSCPCTRHPSTPPTGTSSEGFPSIARLHLGLRRPSFGVPGCDVAGRVVAVDKDVTTLRPDDEMFASSFMHGFGTFPERVSIPERLVAQAIQPHIRAGCRSAARRLDSPARAPRSRAHRSGPQRPDRGGSGGVATYAVQIRKSPGGDRCL